ncbi:hypothetical protein DRQ36_04260 [bacterium]|nr:MAG: hypothetical protein DRQ36_04260 [bacterium]
MVTWTIAIAMLSLVMVIGAILNWGPVIQTVLSYMVLLVALAILHRIWSKTKAKRIEILEDQLNEMLEENKRLKEKAAQKAK